MQFVLIPLIGLVLFYIDTLINSMMPIHLFNSDFYFTSHLVLLYLLMLAVYKNPSVALIIGVLLGVVSDIYLSTIYGIYTFSYIAFIMLMAQLFKVFYKDIVVMMGLLLLFIMLFETVFYIVFISLTDTSIGLFSFVIRHAIPAGLMNLILMMISFPLILKLFERVEN